MSFIIEQNEDDSRFASEFSAHAELDRVTLVESTARKAADISVLSRPFEIRCHYEPGPADVKRGCANLQTRFDFRATDESGNEAVMLTCTLEASYSLEKDYDPGTDVVTAFHSANAVFNSWPFFREYVQSTVLRMNLPAPPVPLLRLIARRKKEPGLSAAAEVQTTPSSPRRRRQAKSPRS